MREYVRMGGFVKSDSPTEGPELIITHHAVIHQCTLNLASKYISSCGYDSTADDNAKTCSLRLHSYADTTLHVR
jgi:hypothetical protein